MQRKREMVGVREALAPATMKKAVAMIRIMVGLDVNCMFDQHIFTWSRNAL